MKLADTDIKHLEVFQTPAGHLMVRGCIVDGKKPDIQNNRRKWVFLIKSDEIKRYS